MTLIVCLALAFIMRLYFFLKIRRLPRCTLFPYTTLFRSYEMLTGQPPYSRGDHMSVMYRSEEHTSELQSHSDLVCRLLLEKNNTKGTLQHIRNRRQNSLPRQGRDKPIPHRQHNQVHRSAQ